MPHCYWSYNWPRHTDLQFQLAKCCQSMRRFVSAIGVIIEAQRRSAIAYASYATVCAPKCPNVCSFHFSGSCYALERTRETRRDVRGEAHGHVMRHATGTRSCAAHTQLHHTLPTKCVMCQAISVPMHAYLAGLPSFFLPPSSAGDVDTSTR